MATLPQWIEARVIQKIATEAEWNAITLVPYKGEFCIVGDNSGKVYNIKVGDGVNTFPNLDYMFDSIQQNVGYIAIESNALPTPEGDVAWGMVTEGTYTFGGDDAFTVPDGHWGIANYNSGAWSLVDMGELPNSGTKTNDAIPDLTIEDDNYNELAVFSGGHFETKNFSTRRATQQGQSNFQDLSIEDENGNAVLAIENGNIKTKNFDSSNIPSVKRGVKILFIGNSFAQDLAMYVPYILSEIDKDIQLTIGIAFYPGCSLEQHLEFINSGDPVYTYNKVNNDDPWTLTNNQTIHQIVNDESWDVISFQQRSIYSRDYTTYQPFLNDIVNWIYSQVDNCTLAWLITQALPNNNTSVQALGITSDEFMDQQKSSAQQVFNDTPLKNIIPAGVAVQYARGTSLNTLGVTGELCYDRQHLQNGIGCLTGAYVITSYLLYLVGSPRSFWGNKFRPTSEFESSKNMPGWHGATIGINDANCLVSQQCAIKAVKEYKGFNI